MKLEQAYVRGEPLGGAAEPAVTRALRRRDGSAVVLKVLQAFEASPEALRRLRNEFAVAGRLEGPRVVRALALETYDDGTVLELESYEVRPPRVAPGAADLAAFFEFADSAAAALASVHEQHVVHKDIKPDNLVAGGQPGVVVRLAGFGVASPVPREAGGFKPLALIEGTLAYMAPEQTGRMNRAVDGRADLYSLGVTLYEELTGRCPFEAADPLEWVHCHVARAPTDPAAVDPRVPAPLGAIVMKLLAKMPEDRYESALGLRRDLAWCREQWATTGAVEPFPLGRHDLSERFRIPQRLYGRRAEVACLQAAFERVASSGAPECVFVSGYAGIGKSSLVQELHGPVVRQRGLFLWGKFDQYRQDAPYAAIAQALRPLVLEILAESEARVAAWRRCLQAALGLNGRLVTDVLPQLALVVGPQPPVPVLALSEAEQRINTVFRRFLSAFVEGGRPAVLFLDDLQWADPASMKLIHHIATHPDTRHLLLLGAYRDNEVGPSHPLVAALDRLRQDGAKVEALELSPLDPGEVGRLIADATRRSPEEARPLTELVVEKTSGNPFFVNQFLTTLYEDGLVAFDARAEAFGWNVDEIRARGFTENVVDLMVAKLQRLPPDTQGALKLAACIGSAFEIEVLAIICDRPEEAVRASLAAAFREGVVASAGPAHQFLHDRIRQAAYSLIAEADRPLTHLRIGRLLLSRTPEALREGRLFDIVGHFNEGLEHVRDPAERARVSELNLAAGRRAKAAAAYASALRYLDCGVRALDGDAWEARYQVAFALHLERAQCECLAGELAASEALFTGLAGRARTKVDAAAVACAEVNLHTTRGDMPKAVGTAIACLAEFGIDLAPHPTPEQVRPLFDQVWRDLGGRPIEALLDLPTMSDPETVAAMDLLTALQPPALFTDANLLCQLLCHVVGLSLERGNADGSGIGYLFFGMVLPSFGMYQEGYRFGKLGYDLVERRGLAGYKGQVYLCFGQLINPWTRHLSTNEPILQRAWEAALEASDLTWAGYTRNHLVSLLLAKGDPLTEVYDATVKGLEFARKVRFGLVEHIIVSQQRLVQSLRGLTSGPGSLSGDGFDEAAFEAFLEGNQASLAIAVCWHFIRKSQARFFAGDHVGAVSASRKARALIWTSPSFLELPEYHYYSAMAHAQCFDESPPEGRAACVAALEEHEAQFREWARHGPENFAHRHALVGAELARVRGDTLEAERLYEEAIRGARAGRFVHHEAVGWELAARFYRARGFDAIAEAYLRHARARYEQWGAAAKVRQLDGPHARPAEGRPSASTTLATGPDQLDLLSVLKASQTIAGEIVEERLLGTLLRVVAEGVGARRAVLVVPAADGELQVAAEIAADGGVTAAPLRPLAAWEGGPQSFIHLVERTRDEVVTADLTRDPRFAADPYAARGGARSAMGAPLVKRGKLMAVLYLENDLAADVFTATSAELLRLLGGQIAISLENARLYRQLETAMTEARRAMGEAQKSERLKAQFLAVTTHELRTPLNAIINVPRGLQRHFERVASADCGACGESFLLEAAEEVSTDTPCPSCGARRLKHTQRWQVRADLHDVVAGLEVVERSGRHLLEIVNSILDLSRLEAGYVSTVFEPVSVRDALAATEEIVAPLAAARGVTLRFAPPDEGATLVADALMIRRVLTNVVGNAVKFSDAGAAVDVACTMTDDACTLSVRDEGPGIATDQLPGIFEGFRQAHAGTTRAHGGAGLGLAISRRLVELHGGTIDVASAPGAGSTFTIRLPRRRPAPGGADTALAALVV